jgi:hypothetical protein
VSVTPVSYNGVKRELPTGTFMGNEQIWAVILKGWLLDEEGTRRGSAGKGFP